MPPSCDVDGLLRWVVTIEIGDNEPYSPPLSAHQEIYESARRGAARTTAQTLMSWAKRKTEAALAARRR